MAERVKAATARAQTSGRLQSHLRAAGLALPTGRAGAPVLGRATAVLVIAAFHAELDKRHPRRIEGGAVAFCAALGVKAGVDAASSAMRLVAAVTPILRRDSRFRWSADLATLKTARPGDLHLEAVLSWPSHGHAEPAAGVTSAAPPTGPESEPDRTGSREHACAVVPSQYSAADEPQFVPEQPGGLGGASAPPAEQAGAGPDAQPASDGDAPVVLTRSAWHQAVPAGVHVQRLRELLDGRVGDLPAGSARIVADRLARDDGRWTSRRERWGLVRALLVFERRRLVCRVGDGWTLPTFAIHEAMDLFDLCERPSPVPPTLRMAKALERRGVNAAGLSRGEARVLSYRLHARQQMDLLSYRQLGVVGQALGQPVAELSRALVDIVTSAEMPDVLAQVRAARVDSVPTCEHEGWA